MADKTTTLTTQTGDSIYPNVLDENIPDTIARVSDVNKLNGGKQDKLTAGSNITIEGTTISATRPENRALYGDLAATDEEFTGGTGGGGGATGGGGVSPTLNLLDFSGDDGPTVRTSITEEEKQNIEKGLYNSVLYFDSSLGETALNSVYFPENAIYAEGDFIFSIYRLSYDETSQSSSIISTRVYGITIGEKNSDGTYPIEIQRVLEAPFSGSGSIGSSNDISHRLNLMNDDLSAVRTSITEEEKDNISKGLYHSVLYVDPSLGEAASLSYMLPENAFHSNVNGRFGFSIYKVASNDSITGARLYELRIGEQGSDGTYPITVSKIMDLPFGGDNLLQKPSGLTKTELVSVGPNGQENIEIGDNLTLTNGKLSATGGDGGSNVNVLEFDINQEHFTGDIDLNKVNIIKNGSYDKHIITSTVDLGTAKLGSLLVPNLTDDGYPDGGILAYSLVKMGDNTGIARTLMHARYFSHFILLSSNTLGNINFNYYDTRKEPHIIDTLKAALKGRTVSCSGYIDDGGTKEIATYIEGASNGSLSVGWFNISDGSTGRTTLDNTITISDTVKPVE